MNTISQIRHTAALFFVIPYIVAPSVVLIMVILLFEFFSPSIVETVIISREKFFLGLFGIFCGIIFIVAPLGYKFAKNNTTFLKKAVNEHLDSLEELSLVYGLYIHDTQREVAKLHENRGKFLANLWLSNIVTLELTIAQKINEVQKLINSFTSKEKIRHQEYILSLNNVLITLQDIHTRAKNFATVGLSDSMYEQLCSVTQKSFDDLVLAHEKHIDRMKGVINNIHLQMEEATQLLA